MLLQTNMKVFSKSAGKYISRNTQRNIKRIWIKRTTGNVENTKSAVIINTVQSWEELPEQMFPYSPHYEAKFFRRGTERNV